MVQESDPTRTRRRDKPPVDPDDPSLTPRQARKAARRVAPKRTPKAPGSQHSGIKVALSSSSVYPLRINAGFEIAARLGYDGIEIMVWTDPVSQSADALTRLSTRYGVPILAIHAPTLLVTQRVWGKDPWGKVHGAVELASALDVQTVVLHPPFRWQVKYAEEFESGVAEIEDRTGVALAIENMYPWRAGAREVLAYLPGWDPTEFGYRHYTLDLSHAATAGIDSLELAKRMGDRLRHLHLTDGSGSLKDEHLIPGRGNQPCAEVLSHLSAVGFDGHVVLEVNTRKARNPAEREADLSDALAFARYFLDRPVLH